MEAHEPPDLTYQLPRDIFYQLIHRLRGLLDPPVSNSPEDLVRRDNAAIAQIAALLPVNADEANLALQYVAACIQAERCIRLSQLHPDDAGHVLKCTAQASSMMRQAKGFRSMLLRVQAVRQKREKDAAATDSAAMTELCVAGLMAEALARKPEPAPAAEDAEPQHDWAAEADQYAAIHSRRAAIIRKEGHPTAACGLDPILPELVHAIVTGTSRILCALDS